MPRGFKRDEAATKLAYATGKLIDEKRRSFISWPKFIVDECNEGVPKPHLVLYGKDKGTIRVEIFRRNREANDGENRCWKCHRLVFEELGWPDPLGSSWHHVRHRDGERCDCPENGVVSCVIGTCHKEEHLQVQFGS